MKDTPTCPRCQTEGIPLGPARHRYYECPGCGADFCATTTGFRIFRPCGCGSGLESEWEYDARGIELGRMCPACRERRRAAYRPEVLTSASYEADEPIEAEDY